jgi:hypothetical protein
MVALKDRFAPDAATSAPYTEAYYRYTGLYESPLGMYGKE